MKHCSGQTALFVPIAASKGRTTPLKGKAHRPGLWKCKDCRKQFSVTVGMVFERSKIAFNVWLMAVHLIRSSKKAISSHQIHRVYA